MTRINTIRYEGGSRVLAVTKVIPATWLAVDIQIIKSTKKSLTLRIDKVK